MKFVRFFGFGANASPSLMKALLGRVPKHQKVVLEHYRLYIEPWVAIPDAVRHALKSFSWTPSFQRYVIRPKRRHTVSGTLWNITSRERALISAWDMNNGTWTEPQQIVLIGENGDEILAETDILPEWDDRLYLPHKHPTFLNPRSRMYTAATTLRKRMT